MLDKLIPPLGTNKKKKRVGRGPGCHGKTSGRGHKGQRSRSGGRVSAWFEGGQTPLRLRSPKRGFRNSQRIVYDIVNINDLNKFNDCDVITPEELKKAGLVSGRNPVKILGSGEIGRAFIVKANRFSEQAIKKLEERGGRAEIV
ncbi:MAG: 50S ribosomal protein L15 [Deltaproteobacteria bacterium]|nr:50S ribosomal protein L15 [Deltaproteobacteria bacterium]